MTDETPAPRGLLDTSVVIARESARPYRRDLLPDQQAFSVITVGELEAGVLAAADTATRALRLATLRRVTAMSPIPITQPVASEWANLRAHLVRSSRRVGVNDLWIAATALAHRIPLVTEDDDFDPLDGVAGLEIIRI